MRDSIDDHLDRWAGTLDTLDPTREAVLGRLSVLGRHLTQRRREILDAGGLQRWQFKVLLMLRRAGPPYEASPSELADHLALTRGALSARLRPLEADGLITRSAGDGDRRRVRVRLTPAGLAAWQRQSGAEDVSDAALLAPLTPAEQRLLADLLRRLVVQAETGRA
ncbi:MarR family winged helix-turn-helix transcriptional regulator [Actinoplanes palleronii]|uniref:MarR family transcriptional regulator n=1 Tax=Actinoplanes palleronii TaxID=113570 RepID=A0ABQ4B9F6_9ACTN|nr:MarR family transcriptional regulator [Actinoplanes palleronii]GIE67277.1 MarR family transcriptional regulator [Actinoplanes palleronii]